MTNAILTSILITMFFILALLVYVAWQVGMLPSWMYKEDSVSEDDSVSESDLSKIMPGGPIEDDGPKSTTDLTHKYWADNGYEVGIESGVILCNHKEPTLEGLFDDLKHINDALLGQSIELGLSSGKLSFPGLVLELNGKRFKDYVSKRALNALEK